MLTLLLWLYDALGPLFVSSLLCVVILICILVALCLLFLIYSLDQEHYKGI